jgi:hypothetical protein
VEVDRDPQFDFLRVSQVDFRHRASGRAGVFRSDSIGAIKNVRSGEVLVCGFLDARRASAASPWTSRVCASALCASSTVRSCARPGARSPAVAPDLMNRLLNAYQRRLKR